MTETIGEGGNAHIVLDSDTHTVSKICKATTGEKVERLNRELEILKCLSSALPELNVPKPVSEEIETDGENSFFRLTYINGDAVPLDEVIGGFKGKPVNPFAPEDAVFYFMKLLEIVEAVHSAEIIHRDIKPNNILISLERRELWLIDFGLACYVGTDEGLITNDAITTEEFSGFKNALIRLEEFKADNLDFVRDPRSDLSLCCAVFCYMLTGRNHLPMFTGRNFSSIFGPKYVDPLYRYIICKGIQFYAEDRYQSTSEIFSDLEITTNHQLLLGTLTTSSFNQYKGLLAIVKSVLEQHNHPLKTGSKLMLSYDKKFVSRHTSDPKEIHWGFQEEEEGVLIYIDVEGGRMVEHVHNENTGLEKRRIISELLNRFL